MTASAIEREMHNELFDQLESIGQWWPDGVQASISAMNAREVMIRLAELRIQLKEHFQMEEAQGLLPDDSPADPRFARESDRLLAQHNGLMDRLNAVLGAIPLISDDAKAWSVAKEHFDEFRKQLENHERAEMDLLQSACGENLGIGD